MRGPVVSTEKFGFREINISGFPYAPLVRQCARRGCTRGRQPSCGGSRQQRYVPALFAGA